MGFLGACEGVSEEEFQRKCFRGSQRATGDFAGASGNVRRFQVASKNGVY